MPPKSALSVAMEISQEMATLPQRCLRVDRMSVYNAAFEGKSLEESLKFEYEHGKSVINVLNPLKEQRDLFIARKNKYFL